MIKDYKCKDCTERYVGCHSNCESYQNSKKANEAEKAKIRSVKKKKTNVL